MSKRAPHQIKATIRYVVKGERAVTYSLEREKSYWPADDHDVMVTDLRSLTEAPTLERKGFVMLREPTAVKNFLDAREIEHVLYPEAVSLAMRINGAAHAIAFGPATRSDNLDDNQSRPAFGAHVDFGRRTIDDVARHILGADADHWLNKRVVLMNLWRPITTVYRAPLALCDASTVQPDDLYDSEIRDRVEGSERPPISGYNLSYNPDHRWYYASCMQPEELFAFKLYDSDPTQPQWTGHTAINDPESAADSPPRKSIEIRTISFI